MELQAGNIYLCEKLVISTLVRGVTDAQSQSRFASTIVLSLVRWLIGLWLLLGDLCRRRRRYNVIAAVERAAVLVVFVVQVTNVVVVLLVLPHQCGWGFRRSSLHHGPSIADPRVAPRQRRHNAARQPIHSACTRSDHKAPPPPAAAQPVCIADLIVVYIRVAWSWCYYRTVYVPSRVAVVLFSMARADLLRTTNWPHHRTRSATILYIFSRWPKDTQSMGWGVEMDAHLVYGLRGGVYYRP